MAPGNDFFLTRWVFLGLRWVYEDITGGHVFWTILIFTIVIRLLTIFGDIQSRKSSIKMQAVQPEIQKLQKKYANNPQKLQQAQSKLMKDNGVSMFAGCLPMLLTMPLFFIFIAAFRQWGYEQMARVLVELETTGQSTLFSSFNFLWVHNIWQPDNGLKPVIMAAKEFLAIPNLKQLMFFYENPSAAEIFQRLGFFVENVKDIPQSSIDAYNTLVQPILNQYAGYNNGWFVLPIIAGGTTFLSSWIMQKGQPAPDPKNPSAGTGKAMLYAMPLMSVFFCLSSNAAFAIYWTISNIVSLLTNLALNKKFKKDQNQVIISEGGDRK